MAAAAEGAPPAAATSAEPVARGHAPGSTLTCLAALPRGEGLATGGTDGVVCLWTPAPAAAADVAASPRVPRGFSCTAVLRGHWGEVRALAVLSGGALVSAAWDATLRVWAAPFAGGTTRACAAVWDGAEGPLWAACALPDGGAASGGADAAVRLWHPPHAHDATSADTSAPLRAVLRGHTEDVDALAALACGARLASGATDGAIRIWRLADGACERALRAHADCVTCLAPTRSGGVASASSDRAVRVWRALPQLPSPADASATSPPAPRPEEALACLLAPLRALFPGLRVVGEDGGTPGCAVLQAHAQGVAAVAALPDGRLVSGGSDAALCVWTQRRPGSNGATNATSAAPPPADGARWRVDRVLQQREGPGAERPVCAIVPMTTAADADLASTQTTAHTAAAAAAPPVLIAVAFGAKVRVWDVAAGTVMAEMSTCRTELTPKAPEDVNVE